MKMRRASIVLVGVGGYGLMGLVGERSRMHMVGRAPSGHRTSSLPVSLRIFLYFYAQSVFHPRTIRPQAMAALRLMTQQGGQKGQRVIRSHSQSPILELFPSPSSPSPDSSEPVLESCARRRRLAHEHPAISYKTPQLTLNRRKEWRQIQETMRPLIIVNHRPPTTRALRRPPPLPASLTVTSPLPDHRPSQPQMITRGQGLRARTISTLLTRGAKTSITRQYPPRHPTNPPSCLQRPHLHSQALRVSRTIPLPVQPPPTPSVETVHLPTVLLAQIPPVLSAVVSPQASHTPQQVPSQRQSLDFQSPSIGRPSLRLDNNLVLPLNPVERARHVENLCKEHLSGPSEQCFI